MTKQIRRMNTTTPRVPDMIAPVLITVTSNVEILAVLVEDIAEFLSSIFVESIIEIRTEKLIGLKSKQIILPEHKTPVNPSKH